MIRFAERNTTVTIRRNGQLIVVAPLFRELIALITQRREAILEPCRGWRGEFSIKRLHSLEEVGPDQHRCLCPAGLLPVILRLLEVNGYRVRFQGIEVPNLPYPEEQTLLPPGQTDIAVLNFLRYNDRGLILIPSKGVSRVRLLRQIVMAWPDHKLLILATTQKEANNVAQSLRGITSGVGLATGSRQLQKHESLYQVIVAMPGQLGMIGLNRREIVIAMDARHIVRRSNILTIQDAHQARLYGFCERDTILAPYERDLLAMIFGFSEVAVPQHGCVERNVEFAQVRFEGSLPHGLSLLDIKRRGLWDHPVRNRRIASLAKSLYIGGTELSTHFPPLASKLGNPGPSRVMILVENEQHANNLACRLREWPILTSVPWNCNTEKIILTLPTDSNVNFTDVDIVLRADGGVGLLPLPLPNCLTTVEPHRLVLIDFDDHHHPTLRRRSQQRRDSYLRKGWTPVGKDRFEVLAEQFLQTRPNFEEGNQ